MTEYSKEASSTLIERNKCVYERQENVTKIDISNASPEEIANTLLRLDPNTISKEYLIDLIGYSAFTKLRNDWGIRMRHDEKGEETLEYENNLTRVLIEKRTGAKNDPATLLQYKLERIFRHDGTEEGIMEKASAIGIAMKLSASRRIWGDNYEGAAQRAHTYFKNTGNPYLVGQSDGRYYVISHDDFLQKARNNPIESWNSIEVAHYLDYVAKNPTHADQEKTIILKMLWFWKQKGSKETLAQGFLKNTLKSYDTVNAFMHDYLKRLLSPRERIMKDITTPSYSSEWKKDLRNSTSNDYTQTARVIFDVIINRDKTKTEQDRIRFYEQLNTFFSSNNEGFEDFIFQLGQWGVAIDKDGILLITEAYEKDLNNSLQHLEQKQTWNKSDVVSGTNPSMPLINQLSPSNKLDTQKWSSESLWSAEEQKRRIEQDLAHAKRFREDEVYRKGLQSFFAIAKNEKDPQKSFSERANQLFRESIEREKAEIKNTVAHKKQMNKPEEDLSAKTPDTIASEIREKARAMVPWDEKIILIDEDTKLYLRKVEGKIFYVNDECCETIPEIRNVVQSARYFAKLGIGPLTPVLGRMRALLSRKDTDQAVTIDAKDGVSNKENELMLREFARILFPDERLQRQFANTNLTLDQLEKLMQFYLGKGRHTEFLAEQAGVMKEGEILHGMFEKKMLS